MSSRFLFNAALWDELYSRIPKAKIVRAAVAYLGTGGGALLPLRRGDKLVVDMSLRSVRSGTTNPNEVKKLLQKGVEVFSRGSLHAKFFVIDETVIAGSSNVSKHAKDVLDEAAILTDDAATVRRARDTFQQLCTEPVRKDYLKKCIDEYVPPTFAPHGVPKASSRRPKTTSGKLWIIGGLSYGSVPEREQEIAARVVKDAHKQLLDFERSEVEYTHYPTRQSFFKRLRLGDWLIKCMKYEKGFDVWPPTRFLGLEDYPRGKGKRRYLLLDESPTDAKETRWTELRKRAPGAIAAIQRSAPRTGPVASDAEADALLRLWNARGKLRSKK